MCEEYDNKLPMKDVKLYIHNEKTDIKTMETIQTWTNLQNIPTQVKQ